MFGMTTQAVFSRLFLFFYYHGENTYQQILPTNSYQQILPTNGLTNKTLCSPV